MLLVNGLFGDAEDFGDVLPRPPLATGVRDLRGLEGLGADRDLPTSPVPVLGRHPEGGSQLGEEGIDVGHGLIKAHSGGSRRRPHLSGLVTAAAAAPAAMPSAQPARTSVGQCAPR